MDNSIYAPLIGTPVLIRDHMAGVLFGILEVAAGKSWRLAKGSRKIHYWTEAGAVEGVAYGVGKDSRVTRPFLREQVGHDGVQIAGLTQEQYETLLAMPEWKP